MEVPVPLALVALEEKFFIEELKAARLRVPLTKAQMARRAVVSPSQVGQVEEGVNRFSHNYAISMSRAAWTRTSTLSRRAERRASDAFCQSSGYSIPH